MELFLNTLATGVFATLTIDAWAIFLHKGLGLPVANWAMIGRWIGHIPRGKFTHDPISKSASIKNERLLGWTFHYVIGVAYAALYLLIVFRVLASVPTLLSAISFGVLTVIAPWFVLQPGLGLGICASKAPKPGLTRLLNLMTHTIFGMALYLGWMGANAISQMT